MLKKLKKERKNFVTAFYSNLIPVVMHSRISVGELIVIAFTIALLSFMAAYLLGLFLAKLSTLFSKKKPQEKIRIRAFYISMICLLAHNAISFIVDISGVSFFISIATMPFLILFLVICFLKKHNRRDNAFENSLESGKNNKETGKFT